MQILSLLYNGYKMHHLKHMNNPKCIPSAIQEMINLTREKCSCWKDCEIIQISNIFWHGQRAPLLNQNKSYDQLKNKECSNVIQRMLKWNTRNAQMKHKECSNECSKEIQGMLPCSIKIKIMLTKEMPNWNKRNNCLK
jgi:hypothetical protein